MLTRENIVCDEGELVEENPLIGLRKITSQSEKMASKEGLSHDEKEFQKSFLRHVGDDEGFVRGLLGTKAIESG
jgi:hypothetical protein